MCVCVCVCVQAQSIRFVDMLSSIFDFSHSPDKMHEKARFRPPPPFSHGPTISLSPSLCSSPSLPPTVASFLLALFATECPPFHPPLPPSFLHARRLSTIPCLSPRLQDQASCAARSGAAPSRGARGALSKCPYFPILAPRPNPSHPSAAAFPLPAFPLPLIRHPTPPPLP